METAWAVFEFTDRRREPPEVWLHLVRHEDVFRLGYYFGLLGGDVPRLTPDWKDVKLLGGFGSAREDPAIDLPEEWRAGGYAGVWVHREDKWVAQVNRATGESSVEPCFGYWPPKSRDDWSFAILDSRDLAVDWLGL